MPGYRRGTMLDQPADGHPPERQPIFNIPAVIVGVLVAILGIQAIL